jgi:thioredoxin reductase
VEAAVALAETAARVVLSYRGKALSRCKAKNRQKLDEMVRAGRVELRFGSNVAEVKPESIQLKTGERVEEIANDHLFVCIGGDAPVKWLESVGVKFRDKPHEFARPNTDKLLEQLCGALTETTPESAAGAAAKNVMVDIPEVRHQPDSAELELADMEEQRTVIRFPVEKVRRIA